ECPGQTRKTICPIRLTVGRAQRSCVEEKIRPRDPSYPSRGGRTVCLAGQRTWGTLCAGPGAAGQPGTVGRPAGFAGSLRDTTVAADGAGSALALRALGPDARAT